MRDESEPTRDQLLEEREALRRRIRELEAPDRAETLIRTQRDLALRLSACERLDEALAHCLDAALAISDMDAGGIYLVDDEGVTRLANSVNLTDRFLENARRYAPDSPNVRYLMRGEAAFVSGAELGALLLEGQKAEGLRTLAILPVRNQGRIIACVNIASHTRASIPETTRQALATTIAQIGSVIARIRAQEDSRRSATLFRRILERNPVPTVVSRVGTGEFVLCNESFVRLSGRSREEILGRSGEELGLWARPEDRAQALEEILTHGRVQGLEVRYKHPDGHERPVLLSSGRVDYEGEPHLLSMAVDLTELRAAEEARLELETRLLHAQKLESLGVLAGGIAHDFNNILVAILGNADLALDLIAPHAPARDHLLEIERAAKRAADLSNQMLAYSGRGRFVIEPIDLNAFVEEMTHLLEVSISKKAELRFDLDGALPVFDGDVTQIRQIILNLITNASESLGDENGVVALSTGTMDCDRAFLDEIETQRPSGRDVHLPEGRYAYLEIADTGCGMDDETLARVFDPFFSTKFTGRGLGMSAVLGIVRGHGGAIHVRSEVGRGTTFCVLFPARPSSATATLAGETAASDETEWRGRGTVLVVDDEESVREVGVQMVSRFGFSTITAVDGQEAVDVYRNAPEPIVCVLLDLTMPRLDGEGAFREIRRIDPEARVVLCSGYGESEAMERFEGQGLAGFVAKPFRLSELRDCLRAVVE